MEYIYKSNSGDKNKERISTYPPWFFMVVISAQTLFQSGIFLDFQSCSPHLSVKHCTFPLDLIHQDDVTSLLQHLVEPSHLKNTH